MEKLWAETPSLAFHPSVSLLVQSVPSPRSAAVFCWKFFCFVFIFLVLFFWFSFFFFIFYNFSSWSDLEFRFVLSCVSALLSVKPCAFKLFERTCTERNPNQ